MRQLTKRLHVLEPRLRSLDPADLVAVVGGKVMRVADYLVTRVVEQVVHLDDLARSITREPWPYPLTGQDLAIELVLTSAAAAVAASHCFGRCTGVGSPT